MTPTPEQIKALYDAAIAVVLSCEYGHHEIGEVSQLETALDAINGRDYGKRVIFDPRKAESEKSMQKLADFNQEIGL